MRAHTFLVAAVLGSAALPHTAGAQSKDVYPSRTVRLIVPNVPGGATDFIARLVQAPMAEQFRQQIVVDNRGGAAGNIALETAARAAPDGYTLMIGSNTQAINPSIYPKFPVTPLQHLIPVTQLADVPGSLVVHPSLPAKSVPELIAHLKANPGKLNFGSPSPSSANRLAMEMFMRHTGTKMQHVPYKGGSGQMLVALMANEVNLAFATFSSTVNFAESGPAADARRDRSRAAGRHARRADHARARLQGHAHRNVARHLRAPGDARADREENLRRRDEGDGEPRRREAPRRRGHARRGEPLAG